MKRMTRMTSRAGRRKIVFLLHNAYAIGGTVRTTLNLASALAERHDVEIVSMSRHRAEPRFAVDPRITLVPLVDTREGSADLADPAYAREAVDFPVADKRHHQYTRLTDLRARAYLESCDADVVIGTRPGINVYIALGPRRALRIAQEHLRHDAHAKRLRTVLARHYRDLDAVVTMTGADAEVYRTRMPLPGVRVVSVPNIVPEVGVAPSDGTAKVIAAAGRLVPGKRYDVLLEAFCAVAAKDPDWELRIYGGGAEKERLQGLIDGLGLAGQARLMGVRTPIEAEFAQASLVVSASDAESFGMTLVEAMRCGVPVVSTDCPSAPPRSSRTAWTAGWCPCATPAPSPTRCSTWSWTTICAGRWAPRPARAPTATTPSRSSTTTSGSSPSCGRPAPGGRGPGSGSAHGAGPAARSGRPGAGCAPGVAAAALN